MLLLFHVFFTFDIGIFLFCRFRRVPGHFLEEIRRSERMATKSAYLGRGLHIFGTIRTCFLICSHSRTPKPTSSKLSGLYLLIVTVQLLYPPTQFQALDTRLR